MTSKKTAKSAKRPAKPSVPKHMSLPLFYKYLRKTKKDFQWDLVSAHGAVRAVYAKPCSAQVMRYCPITAVAELVTGRHFHECETISASEAIHMNNRTRAIIVSASDGNGMSVLKVKEKIRIVLGLAR